MRIGVFGGSFDPIHLGHLILAEQCREQAQLDKVLFIPTAVSPLKQNGPLASDRQRVEMVSLAIAGHKFFEISTLEIERGEKSFTVDTLNELSRKHPEDELFLLMGQDSLRTFEHWKEPGMICQLATPIVVARPDQGVRQNIDFELLRPFVDETRFHQILSESISSRLIDVSSTDIRNRVTNSQSIRFLTTRSVEKYIETAKLYQG